MSSTISTSLNLRALLKTAIARSGLDTRQPAVAGLTPSAKSLFVAGAAHERQKGLVLYVVPTDADLEQAAGDVRFFLASLDGLSSAAADRAVLPFPSHEVDPYRGLAPHVGVTSVRARALHAIANGTARVVVSSAAGLLPRVTSPSRLRRASVDLRPGQDVAPTDLAELLVDAGFSREDPVDEHGEFTVRGGIVDVFPAGAASPVRLEFIGDTIESLRTYDPSTQRSQAAVDQVAIVPLQDVLNGDRNATLFDYLARAKGARIIVSERDEVDAQAIKVSEQARHSYAHATGADLEDEEDRNEELTAEEWDELSADEDDADIVAERAVLKSRKRLRPRSKPTIDAPAPSELFADWTEIEARL